MHVYTYEYIKLINDERVRRSLANYEAKSRKVSHRPPKPDPVELAEVVELEFETGCNCETKGA